MKKVYLLLLTAVFASCGPDLETDTKIVSEIKVVDSQGNPIQDAYVEIIADYPNSWLNEATLNYDYSNGNGDTFMLFSPPNDDNGFIGIAAYGDNPIDETPTSPFEYTHIQRIKSTQCIGYRLPVDQIVLYRTDELVGLALFAPGDDGPNQYRILDLSIDGVLANGYYYNAFDLYDDAYFRAVKNQTITLHYTVYEIGSGERTEHTETVEIGTEDLTHTLSI